MAPPLSPSSSKLRRGSYHVNRRRNTPVFTIILLVLSQNVWNTLQCGTGSSPSMKNRPSVQVTPEEVENEGGLRNELGNEMVEETSDRNFGNGGLVGVPGKKDRNQYHPNSQNTLLPRLCSNRLLEALKATCGKNNFNSPLIGEYESTTASADLSLSEILKNASKRSVKAQRMLQRRLPRNVVDDCCHNSCSFEYMRLKFCNDPSKIPTTTERTTTVDPHSSLQPQYKPPTSTSEEYNPALYTYSLANFLKFITRKFSHTNPQPVEEYSDINNKASEEGVDEGVMGEWEEERDLPMPQPRIQDNPSNQGVGGRLYQQRPQASKSHQRQQGNGAHSRQRYGNSEQRQGSGVVSAFANEGNGATFTNYPSSSFTNHLGDFTHHNQHHRPSTSNHFGASFPAYFDPGTETHAISSFPNIQQTPEVNENVQRASTNLHLLVQPESPRGRVFRVGSLTDDESLSQIAGDF